ncbi:MAG: hypothetical protein U0941_28580 [Planctomycetaceae bacterium]
MSDQPESETIGNSSLLQMLAESILPHACEEIARHKWIESEKARKDLGQQAVEDWLRRFWWRFCRWRRLEHVEGERCWREFNDLDFAILRKITMERPLLDAIMSRMKGDGHHIHDNLEIIVWAVENSDITYQRVEEFLLLIDINSARLPIPSELRLATVA